MVHPKGSWVPHKPFPLQKILGNLMGDQSLQKVMIFGPLFLGPKRAPGLPGPTSGVGGSKHGVRSQTYQSQGIKNHAEFTGQCPKRSHLLRVMAPTILGWESQILGGNHSAPGATPLTQGQPICPWGNPSAPGATPLPLGQPLCPLGNPFAPGATPLPQGL